MNNTQHTPAPWFAYPTGEIMRTGPDVLPQPRLPAIAFAPNPWDAYLMAAAPDLLEALEATLDWMRECEAETGRPMGDGLGYKGRMQKPVIVEKMRAAVAKARGQQ